MTPQTIASAIYDVNSTRFRSDRYYSLVNIKEVRLARLQELLAEQNNNKAALARLLGKQPAQVSQWFNGVRTITEESAREIEKKAKRPSGWMDDLNTGAPPSREALVLDEALRSLGADARREALEFVRFKLERARNKPIAQKIERLLEKGDTDE